MAYNTNAAAASNVTNGNFEKALGFININLPSMEGGTVKLGAIRLLASDERQKELYDALKKNPEAVLNAITQKLTLTFGDAERVPGKGFNLGL